MAEMILDLFGGDNGFEQMIDGIKRPLERFPDLKIALVGDKNIIHDALREYTCYADRITIIDAKEVLTNNDNPMLAVKNTHDYSITKAFDRYAAQNEASCLISVGNTGAVIISSVVKLGLKPDVSKPSLACLLPTDDGDRLLCLLDCGANLDVSADDLVMFAVLGCEYMNKCFGLTSPSVALLSVGKEDTKGNAVTKQAFTMLKESGMNFIGNIEPYDIFTPAADVVVCDGFAGNIILKNTEATGLRISRRIMAASEKENNICGDDIDRICKDAEKLISFNDRGGAVVFGTGKYVLKAHGKANADTIESCIFQAYPLMS